MHVLRFFDNICYLFKQQFQFSGIFVLLPRVKDKTDSLETLDPSFVLIGLAGEVTAGERDLIQVFEISLIIFVHGDDPVDDFGPIIESVHVTDEEIVLVEDLQYFWLQIFDKEYACSL